MDTYSVDQITRLHLYHRGEAAQLLPHLVRALSSVEDTMEYIGATRVGMLIPAAGEEPPRAAAVAP